MRTFRSAAVILALMLSAWSSNSFAAVSTLAEDISFELSTDPYFGRYYIQVETFGGLAVLHGWVQNRFERQEIMKRVKRMEGVERVYSYIITDDVPTAYGAMSDADIVRTMNRAQRVQVSMANMNDDVRDLGVQFETQESAYPVTTSTRDFGFVDAPLVGIPETTAAAVKTNLTLDDITSAYNLQVDSYAGIVFLHGSVPDSKVAKDAEQIAARTPGVRRVVSYLSIGDTGETVLYGPLEIALYHPDERPRFRTQPAEPQYVRYNTQPECR